MVIIVTGGLIPNFFVATLAGFALGGNVTLSSALYAKVIPDGQEGSLFGIASIFALFGGAIGPLVTGFVADFLVFSLRYALFVPLVLFILAIPFVMKIQE